MGRDISRKTNKGVNSGNNSTPPPSDASYAEKAAFNLQRQAETISQSVTASIDRQQAIENNPKASPADKTAAKVLAGAEMGLSMAGNLMGIGMRVSESLMMPMFEKMSFLKGMACLPVLKQTDPVMGIDVHNVIIPPSPVVPMPHPYIGILMRPKDFVSCAALSVIPVPPEPQPVDEESDSGAIAASNEAKALNLAHTAATIAVGMIGASVKLGDFLPRAVAGTPTKNVPHIPMGVGFSPPFATIQKNVGHSFLGSLTVLADNDPLSGSVAHLHNDCWDVGVKNVHSEDGIPMAIRFYVPSGIQTSIPTGKPVLTNPVPIPINPMAIGQKLLKAGLGKLGKAAKKISRKAVEKALNKIGKNPKLKAKMGGCDGLTKLSKKYGLGLSHPVDAAEGYFYTDNTDFSLPGVIPLEFERTYYSYSNYHGPLGVGWHHTYDMALAFDREDNVAALRMTDGRTTGFQIPARGSSFYNRREKLWLHRTDEDTYYLSDLEGLMYHFTEKEYRNPFNKTESHLLQSISNHNGYALRFTYDDDGILTKIIDTAGRDILFENDGKGHFTTVSLPVPPKEGADGHAAKPSGGWSTLFDDEDDKPTIKKKKIQTKSDRTIVALYSYDTQNRLIQQTDALGHAMHFEYDGFLMKKEVWRSGLTWRMIYKGTGTDAKCIEISGDNNLMHYKINFVAPDCTIATDSLGNQTTYYHRNGFVIKQINPNGGEEVFRYNDDNELEWTVDAIGNGEGQTHDELGNLVTKTAADGGFTHLKYENQQFPYLPTAAVDAVGGRWQWTYDGQGNLTKRTDPTKAETLFEYADGLLTTITGSEGQQTKLEYDMQGNLTRAIAPDGGINRWWYDRLGQCLKHENAKGGVTEYEYDMLGQVTKVKEPDGNVRELAYDKEGNVIHAKDADRDVHFSYRGVNKLATRSERGAMLSFMYDTEDQLRGVVNEAGEEYLFEIDAQGDVVRETGFDGLTRQYYRNLAGQVTSVKRPDGRRTAYEYDPVGRVTKVIYNPDDDKPTEETYEYRRDGALICAVNSDAEVILDRDILGRVTKETCNGQTVTSQYDKAGNRTRITSDLGADIQADYNIMGDVVSLAGGGWQTQYQRDLFGLETGRTFSGGVRTRTERDRTGRVTSHKTEKNSRSLKEKNYLWGTNDKLLSVITDGKTKHFEYDGWGNLSKTLFENGKTELRHPDKTGNLFESLDRMDRKYAKGGQLIKTQNWEYKYDQEGNLIRKKDKHGQTWRYEWNDAGMLAKVKRPDAREVIFKYDALGRRIEKRFGWNVTKWVWDGNVPLHEQKETHTQDYEKDRGYFTQIDRQPLVTWVFEEGTFVPTAKLTEHQQLSIVTNYLGTPEAMYREDGAEVWTCELNTYGKVRSYEGQTKTECPFRYQGQYEDAETGLYYNRFRYYSPDEGMYISQDPIRLEGGFGLYNYVCNLMYWIDPLGLTAAPSDLPNNDGIYIITNGKDSYVGSSGIGEQGMNSRTSSTSHTKAQDLYNKQGTTVEYVRVYGLDNVEAGNGRTAQGNRNIILRYYEQQELDKQYRNHNMQNGRRKDGSLSRILSKKKMKLAEALIKKHNITSDQQRTTCKK